MMTKRDANPSPGTPPSAEQSPPPCETGRFAYGGLERLLHERSRLSILASLSAHAQGVVFNDLKALCALTDGNLSRQLQTLEEAGLIEIWKGFKNNRPQTLVRLTPVGRKRFVEYLAELERVVKDAANAGEEASSFSRGACPA